MRVSSRVRSIGRVLPPLVTAAAVAAATAVSAHQPPPPREHAGTWVMRLGERTFIVLALEPDGEALSGTLTRPEHFETGDGVRYSKISSSVVEEVVARVSPSGDGLRILIADPREPQSEPSEYQMALTSADAATLAIPGRPFEPWSFARAPAGPAPVVATDWDPQRSYWPDMDAPSDPEMERLYRADQQARQDPGRISAEEWAVISRDDAERRRRTLELLGEGRLHTSDDFIRAAFVFQHGDSPDDYLLAHTLAVVAAGKGDESASWIAAATLDRYLQSIGRPQVYGTQFLRKPEGMTQEPYDSDLVPDALRRVLGVPSLERQQEQLEAWAEQLVREPDER